MALAGELSEKAPSVFKSKIYVLLIVPAVLIKKTRRKDWILKLTSQIMVCNHILFRSRQISELITSTLDLSHRKVVVQNHS